MTWNYKCNWIHRTSVTYCSVQHINIFLVLNSLTPPPQKKLNRNVCSAAFFLHGNVHFLQFTLTLRLRMSGHWMSPKVCFLVLNSAWMEKCEKIKPFLPSNTYTSFAELYENFHSNQKQKKKPNVKFSKRILKSTFSGRWGNIESSVGKLRGCDS